jgi:hypothetical protein
MTNTTPKTSFGTFGSPKSHISLGYGTGVSTARTPETQTATLSAFAAQQRATA